MRATPRRTIYPELTDRQVEVVALIAEGLTDAEVAQRLHLTVATERTHVKYVMNALDIHTRAGLTAWYLHRHYGAQLAGLTPVRGWGQ